MRKTYVKGCVVATAIIFLMTGCTSKPVDMTPEQEALVGEYAAMALLRHDANNRSRLVSREEAEAREQELLLKEEKRQEEEQKKEEQEGMDPVEETPVIDAGGVSGDNTVLSLEEFFGLPEGIVMAYSGQEVCDSYPANGDGNEYFALDASEGKRLLVLKFDMINQAQSNQTVDMLSQNPVIRITVNGSYTRFALTTMLMDDLSTYKGEVAAGSTTSLVLLTELDSETAQEVSSVTLSMKDDTNSYKVQLQ